MERKELAGKKGTKNWVLSVHSVWRHSAHNTTQNILSAALPRQPQPSVAGENRQEVLLLSYLLLENCGSDCWICSKHVFHLFLSWTGHRGRAELFFSRDRSPQSISPQQDHTCSWVPRAPAGIKQNFLPKYMGPAWEIPGLFKPILCLHHCFPAAKNKEAALLS